MTGWYSCYSAEVLAFVMFCQLVREFESHPVHFLILFQNFEKWSSKIGESSNLVWAQKTSYSTISAHSALLWSVVRKFIQLKFKIFSRNGVSKSNSNNEIAYFKHFIFCAFILFACHKSEKDADFSDCSWASRNSRGIRNPKLSQSFITRSSLKLV